MTTDPRPIVDLPPATADAEDPDLTVARMLTDGAAARSRLLRDLVLLAALTRSFDGEVLRRLVGRSVADPQFDEAYGQLFEYPFVEQRGEQSWAVHDSIRGPLLKLWETGVDLPSDRHDVLERLEQIYVDRYDSLRRAVADLSRAGEVIRRVSVDRLRNLSESIEDRLIRNATDAVHAALRQSLDTGWRRLDVIYSALQMDYRVRLCDLLVRAWSADESLVDATEHALFRARTAYYSSRVSATREQWQESLDILDAVDRPEDIDLRYATWYYTQRTAVLRGLTRISEAIETTEREIAIHETHHIDDANSAVPWSHKASLYETLWDSAAAIDSLRHAARLAASPARRAEADLDLARVVASMSDEAATVDAMLAALARVRELGTEYARHLSRNASIAALSVLGSRSARLCATLAEQCRQLSVEQGDQGQIEWLLALAHVQTGRGRRADALELFDRARRLAAERLPAYVWEVDASRAERAEALGEPLAGGDANTALLERPDAPSDPWSRARCLTNAGICYRAAGDYDRARDRFDAVEVIWREMGHERGLALVSALRADTARRCGDLDGARSLLSVPPLEGYGYEGTYFEAAARLAVDTGDYETAANHAECGFRVRTADTDALDVIERGMLAVSATARAGRYDTAVGISAEVDTWVRRTLEYVRWQPDDGTQLADEHAARAVRILSAGVGSAPERARSAIDHLQRAIELDSGAPWYRVEIGFAERAAGRQRQAALAFTAAARRFDDSLLSAALLRLAG